MTIINNYSFWISSPQILIMRNYSFSDNLYLGNLPFEYSNDQISNFILSSGSRIFISMMSDSYSLTDHNYFVSSYYQDPYNSYSYSHCTFHDTNGGVKSAKAHGENLYLFHNCDDCEQSVLYHIGLSDFN